MQIPHRGCRCLRGQTKALSVELLFMLGEVYINEGIHSIQKNSCSLTVQAEQQVIGALSHSCIGWCDSRPVAVSSLFIPAVHHNFHSALLANCQFFVAGNERETQLIWVRNHNRAHNHPATHHVVLGL